MKLVVAGGSGQIGQILTRHWTAQGFDVSSLTRSEPMDGRHIRWDGRSLGPWVDCLKGADVLVNLAGRSVNCRYTAENLKQMMDSRVESTRVLGEAIAQLQSPPAVWLQASTATIYSHRLDAANDEARGILGGEEPGAPAKWAASIAIAKAWEAELQAAHTPHTRKVALRSSMIMSPDAGGVFDVMARLARRGLGGSAGNGRQFVSWIHGDDFARALDFILARDDLVGPVNVCSPNPLPHREFAKALRRSLGGSVGLPAPAPVLELGAIFLDTETELILKSRRVVPRRLLEAGFTFRWPTWPRAADDLALRWRALNSGTA